MIPLFYPENTHWIECAKEVTNVLKTRWWGQSEKVNEFESKFGKAFNYKYCLSVNSGTAALELAYKLIGIKNNDEVLTPILTCTATNIPLKRMGAKIKFVDIDKNNLTIDYHDLKKKISKKTKAIVVVTLGGIAIDSRINKLSKKYKIPLVVDASQSLGVRESFGDYIIYSFQAIKHFTTGDGGMLIVNKKEEYQRAKKLRWFGIDREQKIKNDWQAYRRREMTIDIKEPGYKFHMNDISAVLGIVGLKYYKQTLVKRNKVADYFNKNLKNCVKVSGGANWLYGVIINNRDEVSEKLLKKGIEVNMVHLRNDIYSIFGGKRQNLPNMNWIEERYIYLPIHSKLKSQDLKKITTVFNEINK